MNKHKISGVAHKLDDDINTDYIIAGKYTKTLDYQALAEHLFEDLDAELAAKLRPGDFIVAGDNFGCGSSREQAALAIKYAGIGAVLAKSFARIFFRNAINLGLPALVCDTDKIGQGQRLELDLAANAVLNLDTGQHLAVAPLSQVMLGILREGGLVAYLQRHGEFVVEE